MSLRQKLKETQSQTSTSKLHSIDGVHLHVTKLASLFTEFYLVFWPLESAVSVVPDSKVADTAKISIGDDCTVKEGKKSYKGQVAAVGKSSL